MRVLIYGGRDFTDQVSAFIYLDDIFADWGPGEITVVGGKARGADTVGEEWAYFSGHGFEGYPADWSTHGKAAGAIRNQQMLDTGIDYAVQFPGGKGTADMRSRLKKANIQVWEYKN